MRGASILCHSDYLILVAVAVSICLIGIGTHQITYAQQQQPNANLTSTEQQHLLDGISFQIDNVTFTHHMATVNGIQLHYVMGGKGDPVVLLHGYPQSWYEWRHVMPALTKNYTVVAPDLRGFGDSSKPITGYDGKTIAEDIYQLMT
ncbi:MAG: alpha/beta fold hydrolase, partial [Nitrososphaeraceae archaeon]|nr:alpha/beta fold hydrolase [Nitrososphaeraceae archaeon]